MAIKKIVENVINVGVEHWDREIFDSLIPLPDGTTYNSYVIKGSEKIALIDTVDETKGHLLKESRYRKTGLYNSKSCRTGPFGLYSSDSKYVSRS